MGKKGLSDRVRSKQKSKAKPPPNPFEVKVNKIKHTVVNKKVQKWEKGLPGVSRSKAVKKRKDTLLREIHHMKKSNSLHDKRFGESDTSLTADEKMVQRFALEKKKQLHKGDFNLNEEEEVLTHYGQSLAENLQDTLGSDSEDEDTGGNLKTGDLQFGGFSKGGDEVSWKDKMKEVIADSKKQKYERQAEKEKTLETTNELDTLWQGLVNTLKPKRAQQTTKKVSGFIQLFHNLVMEQKTIGASDKLKTEEEKAKDEADKLKELEAERIARMKGYVKKTESSHRSADDLSDGFALDKKHRVSFAEAEDSGNEPEKEDGEEMEGGKDTEDEIEEQDESIDGKESSDDEEDEGSSDDESDKYSDLNSDDGSDSEEETAGAGNKEKDTEKAKAKSISKKHKTNVTEGEPVKNTLPFIYAAPGSYEELESLLHGHSAEEQAAILSRLRKCHHPSLAEGNKEKLEEIHLYLLQYFGEIFQQDILDKKLVDYVTSNLWELTQTFPESTASMLQTLVVERQKAFTALAQKKKGRGMFASIDTLMYLKLVESLFPTSDFRHPVTTPAVHFITQMLSECPVRNGADIVAGLFLCSLALKFVSLSKRYIPEVVTFLHGLLYLGAEKTKLKAPQVFPPFRAVGKTSDILEVQQQCPKISSEWSISEMLHKEPVTLENDQFRCEAVNMCLDLLLETTSLWEDLPCLTFVMNPINKILTALRKHFYPSHVQAKIETLIQKFEEAKGKQFRALQHPSKKPEPLRLFEPQIEEFWSGKKKKGGPNKEANERQRLNHKYKREMKAAIREIKRDNEVLARHQLDTVMERDAERKRKTKDLMNSLANQEGDFKAIKKMKK